MKFSIFKVADEARLIDGGNCAQAHRSGGKLPKIRHQPWMTIGGERESDTAAGPVVHRASIMNETIYGQKRIPVDFQAGLNFTFKLGNLDTGEVQSIRHDAIISPWYQSPFQLDAKPRHDNPCGNGVKKEIDGGSACSKEEGPYSNEVRRPPQTWGDAEIIEEEPRNHLRYPEFEVGEMEECSYKAKTRDGVLTRPDVYTYCWDYLRGKEEWIYMPAYADGTEIKDFIIPSCNNQITKVLRGYSTP